MDETDVTDKAPPFVLFFGTFDMDRHPRVQVLAEGLGAAGWRVGFLNRPIAASTAQRVAMVTRPWRLVPFAFQSHDEDPLIVFQADHGPRLGIDWDEPDGVVLNDEMHFSIYSAIRLPACRDIPIPDDLTSVNTLRIARSCVEGRPVELLPNRRFVIQADH